MKVKTLRLKETKEFIHILEGGQVGTCDIPNILAATASIEKLKLYYESAFSKMKINYDEFEVVEFDLIEAGEVGADIRNKLSPSLNLISLLEEYFDESPNVILNDMTEEKEALKGFILKEMAQTKISVDYLKKLF